MLELVRVAVATRPGVAEDALRAAQVRLRSRDRIVFFELEPVPVSSSEIRERLKRGEPIDGLVPRAVAAEIERLGLYGGE